MTNQEVAAIKGRFDKATQEIRGEMAEMGGGLREEIAEVRTAAGGSDEALAPVAEGVWTGTVPARILGMPLTATMAALRLSDGSLLVYSPVRLTPRWRAAVEALGAVSQLYAPNLYHHRRIGEWAAVFPAARVHGPSGLARKRPDLRIDRTIDAVPDLALAGAVDERPIDGFRLNESVLFHRPSRTLVVADLVQNIGRPDHPWTRCYAGLMGFYGRVALSRVIRWAGFSDRRAARRSLDLVLELPFERVVVGHGAPVVDDARAAVRSAFDWLPAVTLRSG